MKPYLLVAAMAVAFGTGWSVNGWRVGSKMSNLRAAHDRSMINAAENAATKIKDAIDERDAAQGKLSDIAREGLESIEKTKNETDRLRRCIAAGTCGVRIAAACPDHSMGMSESSGGRVMDTSSGPVIPATVQQDILDLRTNIERTEATLKACQASASVLSPR